jgi:hypothetical protein
MCALCLKKRRPQIGFNHQVDNKNQNQWGLITGNKKQSRQQIK